jgi:hypothetical protein
MIQLGSYHRLIWAARSQRYSNGGDLQNRGCKRACACLLQPWQRAALWGTRQLPIQLSLSMHMSQDSITQTDELSLLTSA